MESFYLADIINLNNYLLQETLDYLTFTELSLLKKIFNKKFFKVICKCQDKFFFDGKISLNNQASNSFYFLEYLKGYSISQGDKTYNDIIAVAGSSSKIYLISLENGKNLMEIESSSIEIECLMYMEDHRILLSGGKDRTIIVFHLDSQKTDILYSLSDSIKILAHLKGFKDEKDNDHVAGGTGKFDKSIQIWKILSGVRIKQLRGHNSSVTSLCQLNKKNLASGSLDKTLRIWNVEKGECIYVCENNSSILSLSLDKLTNRIICGSGRKEYSINIYNMEGISKCSIKEFKKAVWGLSFYRDENVSFLSTGGEERKIVIFDENNIKIFEENIDIFVNSCLGFYVKEQNKYYSVFVGENQTIYTYVLV